MKTLDKIKKFLGEAVPVKYYQGLWNIQFIGKKVEPMFLDHRDDIDPKQKRNIQKEKQNYMKAMAGHEKEVLDALAKMDSRAKWWEKFLKMAGL